MLEKIKTTNLQEGMFVVCSANGYSSLPAELSNHAVSSKADISAILQLNINEVLIDSEKSSVINSFPQTTYSEEILFAREAYNNALGYIQRIFETVEQEGTLEISEYKKGVSPLIDSIDRNNSAAASLTVLARADKYLYTHSLNTAILSAILGRYIGLSREAVEELSITAMLMNIGQLWLPKELMTKKGKLSKDEFQKIKFHPLKGCEYLSEQNSPQTIINSIKAHHEKYDGSGYPQGLSGNDIPQYARIISICDSYDALTSDRPYREAMTPNSAIKHLYSMANTAFHPRYLESFIKCVGIYPVGCFVKLSDGRYGVVVTNTPKAPLLPQVKVVFSSRFRAIHPEFIDLSKMTNNANGENLEIIECIHPKTFKLELDRFLW
ncbi:HD-GYP domain-containing protein [Maridesulfovibrio salexigens]|uniref:Metal dependent phosphohydrolase n=1 Tax=Maridesulfovibrio salexigens (strain ATCC 14822 / DSM 2638 / NCIMB 8403 / VKM B-1763) TaxID=526222 RepID=C6BTN3_MARSD|nr:HD-GYP domain-containing protein [Maridesulfovibrio salexigens]ACS79813.1 metal dependent phosphohydrolase [Maridesulfovibrio salexigens DSM 2638]